MKIRQADLTPYQMTNQPEVVCVYDRIFLSIVASYVENAAVASIARADALHTAPSFHPAAADHHRASKD
ncbi:hypothetical protein [Bradyrhizobium sp. ORS 285]|uniref:hypothetical protein n=1 Tax=Bradyrhizobium sp. ORS 285 TaxID=115808 RepID=UPI001111F531|nr:hypothetical protein [Bradyrhizobium sp. ORS 285]